MLADDANSYDEIPYPDTCFSYTHPDHLAAIGTLFGMNVPPSDRCRVLELGCARGGNIIPMALELPEARFVGIDLSARQIAEAQSVAERLGLRNLDLHAMSILEVDQQLGTFDYIVCHGVYSWVPEPVRDKILAICAELLALDGIAYVSYNTYPGWHARGLIRELFSYHVRRTTGSLKRVQQGLDFLDELVRVIPLQSSSYTRILRTERELLSKVPSAYIYHEHLEETNHPVYFQEFIGRARARGLSFLSEALTPGLIDDLSPEARKVLEGWAEDEIARQQYLDFICNTSFRRTLLCHEDAPRSPRPSPEALPRMSISTGLMPASSQPDVASDATEEFRRCDDEGHLTTNNPLIKAALVALYEVRPGSLCFEDLWERIRVSLSPANGGIANQDDGPLTLARTLLRCFLADLVELHVHPPRFANAPGKRPIASPLARLQAERGDRVTNLRRRVVELEGVDRLMLGPLDGTRDRSAVLEAMRGLVAADEFTLYQEDQPVRDPAQLDELLAAAVEPGLRRLAGLALLVA
jgi:methyltransferase-like protein/2-polyprenyl-3-methyl-5-hydroxy-6-metoxy-1,4-benzoquinol methylase